MITLSDNVHVEYFASSGALALDGKGYAWDKALEYFGQLDTSRFLTVTSSLTLYPRAGNLSWLKPWGCVRPIIEDGKIVGFVNAKGLTNPGLPVWLEQCEPHLDRQIVVSVYSDSLQELQTMAYLLDKRDIAAVEVNVSCPNSGEMFYADEKNVLIAIRRFAEYCRHPLIAKVSAVQDLEFLASVLQPYVKAFSINSVPWNVVFPHRRSPLAHLGGGGVSGKAAQSHTWTALARLAAAGPVPVIGPSVWSYEDIARIRSRGAGAISFGSVFLRYPHKVTDWVRRDQAELRRSQ